MQKKRCNFCHANESDNNPIIAGESGYICKSCIIAAYKMITGEAFSENIDLDLENFSPKMLKSILDQYVIGQDHAKKVFSIAVYNHYKRIFRHIEGEDDTTISKSNVLLIGPTGSGKTLMAQTMAKFLDVPLAITDATSLTEAGYVGEDVENILTKLLRAADGDVEKAQKGIIFIDEIDKIARLGENRSITRDVSGEGVQQALLKIIEGSVVNITQKGGRKHPNQEFVQIDTTNVLFIAGGAFDGIEEIIERRIGGNVMGFNQQKRGKKEKNNILSQLEPDDLVKYGLIPELIGRLHVTATLTELEVEDMVKILVEPKNSLLKQYKKLFELDFAKLTFDDDALQAIAELTIKRKTGARGLRSIMENILLETMYELPDLKGYEVLITKECVIDKQPPVLIKMTDTQEERKIA
jgi:ATP-dependent Clp protease ATP-binding subunit ClpX